MPQGKPRGTSRIKRTPMLARLPGVQTILRKPELYATRVRSAGMQSIRRSARTMMRRGMSGGSKGRRGDTEASYSHRHTKKHQGHLTISPWRRRFSQQAQCRPAYQYKLGNLQIIQGSPLLDAAIVSHHRGCCRRAVRGKAKTRSAKDKPCVQNNQGTPRLDDCLGSEIDVNSW